MSRPLHESRIRVHVVAGGFPPGTPAGHDMDYARLRLLGLLGEAPRVACTVASDFADVERWLPGSACLVTYVAGPFPDAAAAQPLGIRAGQTPAASRPATPPEGLA